MFLCVFLYVCHFQRNRLVPVKSSFFSNCTNPSLILLFSLSLSLLSLSHGNFSLSHFFIPSYDLICHITHTNDIFFLLLTTKQYTKFYVSIILLSLSLSFPYFVSFFFSLFHLLPVLKFFFSLLERVCRTVCSHCGCQSKA